MSRLLTAAEVAELLGTTTRYVWSLGRRGILPRVVLPGGLVRFEEAAVQALIESGRVGQPSNGARRARKRAPQRTPAQVSFRF